ncbi:DNA topoisomerase-3 [Carnobacterium iners]|uniref:DNA topoisomerase n=1 Tax=Carnobacterium iners TaxID=1073423 RepID=A0A1X7NRZ6_9LACT|nr:DNA topoisomerase 3 [Carnobacterium iners]SEK25656.1 DNA topoisomerase-3 [Carnobacterium iners]SMH40497.1 DNA topoisomerase-3 [Carnobacterium iners]
MKTLIIAEKPSVGKEIARVLGATNKNKSYIEGQDVIVTWALGHLLGLKMPEDYKTEWATWNMESLPLIPEEMQIKPLKNTAAQLKTIKQLSQRKDVNKAVIATDAGREGELVARWILEYVKFKKPVQRLWISSQTDQAIKNGFKQLQPSKKYDDLYDAAVARSEADWLVGLNVTRALTVKYEDSLSAGRVQTPTLAMVRKQEAQIEDFVAETFYTIQLMINGQMATLASGAPERIKDLNEAEKIAKHLTKESVVVKEVKEKIQTHLPPLPYDLTELQREANQRYQFSAKKTLSVMQTLYERHKVVSYPRTDSKYLTIDMKETLKDRLQAVHGFANEEVKNIIKKGSKVTQMAIFNNAKVTDHHGIIPTEERVRIEKMDQDEIRIYRMIVERFIGLFLPAYKVAQTTYLFAAAETTFKLKQEVVLENGWRKLEPVKEKRRFKQGEQIENPIFEVKKELTKSPGRLTESSLLQAMEKHSLGTPATRAEIIEKLISNELMERKATKLSVSPKGKQLLILVNPALVTPELTSEWEKSLEQIATGKLKKEVFLKQIKIETKKLIKEIKTSEQSYKDYSLTTKTCPECGELLKERSSREGKMLVCTKTSCSYRRFKEPKVSNKRCAQCHRKMEIHEGKSGKFFKCKYCNVSEKMDNTKNKKITKHETKRLMQKVNKEAQEEVESPLTLALKAAMEKQGK